MSHVTAAGDQAEEMKNATDISFLQREDLNNKGEGVYDSVDLQMAVIHGMRENKFALCHLCNFV